MPHLEFMTLDSNFQPDKLVESYKSLIWTERYSKNGDFQITSNNVEELINLLPLETYVSLRQTTVPMIVEDHTIEKKKNEAPLLTVVGRSLETVLERRGAVNALPSGSARTAWMMPASKESDAAFNVIRTVIGDVAHSQSLLPVVPAISPIIDWRDYIPEITLTLPADYQIPAWSSTDTYSVGDMVGSGTTAYQAIQAGTNQFPSTSPTYWTMFYPYGPGWTFGPSNMYEVKPQDLYSAAMDLINTNHHGLKAVRPLSGETTVDLEIYNGADLTNEVIFDARFDQIENAKYLLSNRGSANVAYVYGTNGSERVLKTAAPEPSGLARRVLLLDETSDTTVTTSAIRKARGLIELYKNNATALFDGEVAEQVSAGYNTTYFLGDILRLDGEYGLSENVRVEEFIRTSDSTGEKAYPAFEAVS